MYRDVLVPIDGGPFSAEIVSQAVTFAKIHGAALTFVHVAPHLTGSALGDAALLYAMAPERFSVAFAHRSRVVLAKAAAAAAARGVAAVTVAVTAPHPDQGILAVAAERGCDLIFLFSAGHPGKLSMMVRSVALDVLAHAAVPVLINNLRVAHAAAVRVCAVLKDEHECWEVVLGGLRRCLEAWRREGAVDADLLGVILTYLRTLPADVVYPKRERHFLPMLALRIAGMKAIAEAMPGEYAEERGLLGALAAAAVGPGRGSGIERLDAIETAAVALETRVASLIARTEEVILLAALAAFTEDDWKALDSAFAEGDRAPRSEDAPWSEASSMDPRAQFVRLVGMLPPPVAADATMTIGE